VRGPWKNVVGNGLILLEWVVGRQQLLSMAMEHICRIIPF
jgi:hypothetical protein